MPIRDFFRFNVVDEAAQGMKEALRRIAIAQRDKARTLDLSDLKLTSVPAELWELVALEILDLSSNQLTSLPTGLWELVALETLDLNANQLTSVPAGLGRLVALKDLYLSLNLLTSVPAELGQLVTLKTLQLSRNQLTSVPAELGQMVALETLSLSGNPLTSVPAELERLVALETLYLSNNQLTSVPAELGQIVALKTLSLSGNQLTRVPAELGRLVALETLYLSANELTELPESFRKLTRLAQLFLHDNPVLGLPAEMLGPRWDEVQFQKATAKPPQEILDYYFSTRGAAGRALREVKLIFVGRGEVGKSSLVDVLRGSGFVRNRPRTDGIAITPWEVELEDGSAMVLMWDFGGQEIMHGTHQFFLTCRSLYVVMVDGRHDRARQDAEYWLKLVRAFGGESTVLLVMNRQNSHPFDVDRQHLASKYGVKLEHFFPTDCERPADIEPLRRAILAEAARMLSVEERFPAKCWEVKTRLAEMKAHGENYLSEEKYAELCRQNGVEDAGDQQKLLRRLADLGTVVSFPDEVKLAELSVLNPEWVTDGIYRVVTNEPLREQRHGQLRQKELRGLLPADRWPKPKHLQYILDLMQKFELCFPVGEDGDAVLVPELLPDVTPPLPDWDATLCVVLLYDYPVLPHGVLPRFITRTHHLSEGRERWRTGVVLADDGAMALIKADHDTNQISVWVRGKYGDARRALLKLVRHHFEHIHSQFRELNPQEKVAIPGHPEVTELYCDLILDERARKQTVRVTIAGERVDYPIADLLNGVESPEERANAHREAERGGVRHVIVEAGGQYNERNESMNIDDHSIHMGDVSNAQIAQTMTNCTNLIQQQPSGEIRSLLAELEKDVKALLPKLPEDKREEAAGNLELMVKAVTSPKPNRPWYSVSSAGLLEASKFVKDFTGNIAGPVAKLGKLLFP